MANTYNNPMNAMSYTNKDFQTIYPELLDAAKELARNWDPTISNESDPGVVLLKINAIIADKNNYNIDKNILENYPETYTQEFSARSQYKQLGYKMPWYRAAEVKVAFKYVPKEGEELVDNEELIVPAFTSVSDTDGNYVYTILEDIVFDAETPNMIAEKNAIQGQLVELKVNGSSKIVLANLDSRNRIYVDDYNIAQNGIFVKYANSTMNYRWDQVENVEVQPGNSTCYEFDIDPISGTPYIQFRQDVRNVINDGLSISYIVTDGVDGSIIAKTLSKFESSTTAEKKNPINGTSNVTLDEENMKISNYSSSTKGYNPETVEEAYYSFKKYVHTFDTLVTLRDYMNAIYESDVVSNSVVTDRTTDIPAHYKVVTNDRSSLVEVKDIVRNDPSSTLYKKLSSEPEEYEAVDVPLMDAFDLRMYLIGHNRPIVDMSSYEDTFKLDTSTSTKNTIITHLDNKKCIQHNFKDLPKDEILLIQNVFPIRVKIAPTYKLSEIQQREVQYNVQSALIKAVNSHEMTFGEEAVYQEVLDIVTAADDRIKLAILDDFDYVTYALYIDKETDEIKLIPISDFTNGKSGIVISDSFSNKFTGLRYGTKDSVTGFYKWDAYSDSAVLYASEEMLDKFRQDVIARNILAGVTPMFTFTGMYEPNLMMDILTDYSIEASALKAELKLELPSSSRYKLRENEMVTFTGPSFIAGNTFAGYSKYLTSPQFNGKSSGMRCLETDATYQLQEGDWIAFFSRGEGEDAPYNCYVYKAGAVIRANFPLYRGKHIDIPEQDDDPEANAARDALIALEDAIVKTIGVNMNEDSDAGVLPSKPMKLNIEVDDTDGMYNFIKNNLLGVNMTSGSRQIEVCRLNQVKITTKDNNFFYVVSNDKVPDGNLEYYTLTLNKDKDRDSFSRVLGPEEFFIYTNSDKTMYEVLGQGTLVEYDYANINSISSSNLELSEDKTRLVIKNLAIDTTDIELNGIQAFTKDCIQFVNSNDKMFLTEQVIYSFVKDDIIGISHNGGDTYVNDDGETEYYKLSMMDNNPVQIGGKYKVTYETADTSGKLPIFELDNAYYNWRVASALHVKMGRGEPMKLQPDKEEVINNDNSSAVISTKQRIYIIEPGENKFTMVPQPENDELYIESTLSIDKMGSDYTDLTYQSAIGGDPINTYLLFYTLKDDAPEKYLNANSGNVEVLFSSDDATPDSIIEEKFTTSLFKDTSYLMTVVADEESSVTVNAYYGELGAEPTPEEITALNKSNNASYYMFSTTKGGADLSQVSFSAKVGTRIEIQPLVQVSPRDDYLTGTEVTFGEILKAIKDMDTANLFKYDYRPDEGIAINDPLVPLSFFESNHVYNPVCMPRAIVDAAYASYLFVNNR